MLCKLNFVILYNIIGVVQLQQQELTKQNSMLGHIYKKNKNKNRIAIVTFHRCVPRKKYVSIRRNGVTKM